MDRSAPEALIFTLSTQALAELKGLAPALGERLRVELTGEEPHAPAHDPSERICALLVVAGGGAEIPPALAAAVREHLADGRYLLAVSTVSGAAAGAEPAGADRNADSGSERGGDRAGAPAGTPGGDHAGAPAGEPGGRPESDAPFREFLEGWRFERIFRFAPELAGCGRAVLDLRLPSDEKLIPGLSHTVGLLLREFGFPRDDWMSTIPLVIDEVLTNAMRHGNERRREKGVQVRLEIDSAALALTVTDEGSGFRREVVADPRSGDRVWRSGGRGLFLIESLMDSVEYRDEGRTVHLVKQNARRAVGQPERALDAPAAEPAADAPDPAESDRETADLPS